VLTAKSKTADYVEASAGSREEAYFCRGCDESVIFKRGRIRIPYFSHRAGSQCAYGATMSLEHLTAQQVLADGIRSRGAHAELEVPMASLVGQDRRIDVLAWPAAKPNARIALEVQKSDITVELIDARTQCYLEAGIAPLWVRLYDFSKWEKPGLLKGRNTIWIDRHFVRSWERWAYEHLGALVHGLEELRLMARHVPGRTQLQGADQLVQLRRRGAIRWRILARHLSMGRA
jgi:competence CoiA-like predicted nuclease